MKRTITNKLAELLLLTVTACILCCTSLAYGGLATVNNGAGNISLTGASDGNTDATGGGTYLTATTAQFYEYGNFVDTGDIYSYVYGVGVDPLNTLGGLTFVYAITNGSLSSLSAGISQVQIAPSGWGSQVELGYATSTVADATTGSLNLGSTVTFNWSPAPPDVGTYYLVVCTAAQNYGLTTATIGDANGDLSGNLSVLGPVAAPEPSTVTLLLLPLGFVLFRAFRKARAACSLKFNKMTKRLIQAATVCLMLCASLAYAGLPTANNNAGNISLTGAADGNPDAMGGAGYLAATAPQFYSFNGGQDFGDIYSYVYGVGVDPLNTLGGYTFVYALTNIYSSLSNTNFLLGQLQIGSLSSGINWGSKVELGYGTSTATDPTTGSLSLNSTVTFNWNPQTGDGYYYLVVGTALQNYALTTAIVGDGNGNNSGNLSVLGPVAAPEPSTVTLLLLPLGFLIFRAFRRARRQSLRIPLDGSGLSLG